MDGSQSIALTEVLNYLSAHASEAVAMVEVQKAWCTPITELGAYSGNPEGFRLRILSRAWLAEGRGVMVKLWFYMPTLDAAALWLERMQVGSCWTVTGRVVDVGHPKYQTIAVSDMQPLSAAMTRVFVPLLAQTPLNG